MDEYPWTEDAESLARGYATEPADQVRQWINRAGELAGAGNLAGAAEELEAVRRFLVGRNHFVRYDNDIWAFNTIIQRIRTASPETVVPKTYQRFLDAQPSLKWDEELTRAQKEFWYGSPNAQVGGEIRIVSPGEAGGEQKKGCFVATAVYGSPMAPEVELLRAFRDERLLNNPLGKRFVGWYYRTSPRWAARIEPRPHLRKLVRLLLLSPLLAVVGRLGRKASREVIG